MIPEQLVWDLESWGETVYKDILAECEKHAEDTWGYAPKDKHEVELALLDSFIEEHTHITTTVTEKGEEQIHTFCGRKKLIEELKEHLLSNDKSKWGLVLTGESGSGKSAVFSMMYKTMMKEDCLVLVHSAGISPAAKSVAELIRKWNRQVREFLGIEEEKEEQRLENEIRGIEGQQLFEGGIQKEAPKTSIEKLQAQFSELLYLASGKKRVLLLIDALDQFEPTPRAEYMTWLPKSPQVNYRLLVTAITGTEKNAIQYHMGIVTRSLDHFTVEEAREMLHSLGRKEHKRLPKDVELEILEKVKEDGLKASSSPLWLSLAVNILMAMDEDDFEKMRGLEGRGDQQIRSYLLEMVKQLPSLPGELFLDLIRKAGRIFGESFTHSLFNFIACSRAGLRESDLEVLLPNQTSQNWDPLLFAGLRRWFRMHLLEQGEEHQWNLTHSILRNSMREKMTPVYFKNLHILIGNHFLSLPKSDTLRIAETMCHLLQPDDKMPAIEYYTSGLEDKAIIDASKILSEIITSGEEELEIIASFPSLASSNKDILPILLNRFIFPLHDLLVEDGNLHQRLTLFTSLKKALENVYGNKLPTWNLGYDFASLFMRLGDIHRAEGRMEEALNNFLKYNELLKALYEVNPHNELLKNGLAVSLERLGIIHQEMGDMKEAYDYYKNELSLFKEIHEVNPQNESLKMGLATANGRLGDLILAMGRMDEALNYYEEFNRCVKELYDANPHNEWFKFYFAISFGRLGDIHLPMGHFEEALKCYFEDFRICKELYEANPRNEMLKNGFAFTFKALGCIYELMEHFGEAQNNFEKYNQFCKELYEANPQDEMLKESFGISYLKLGDIHQATGHTEEALNNYKLYNQFSKELSEANPDNELLKDNFRISFGRLGNIHKEMGNLNEALYFYEVYYQLSNEIYKANPRSAQMKSGLVNSCLKLGIIHQVMSHLEEALKYFDEDFKLSKELNEASPGNIDFLKDLGISYYALAMTYKALGNDKIGNEKFIQWKKIISSLTKNFPQVPKYTQWNQLEY